MNARVKSYKTSFVVAAITAKTVTWLSFIEALVYRKILASL